MSIEFAAVLAELRTAPAWATTPYAPLPDGMRRSNAPYQAADLLGLMQRQVQRLQSEVAEWEKLRDPLKLHVNLLRGLPAKLDRATYLHLAGGDAAVGDACATALRALIDAEDFKALHQRPLYPGRDSSAWMTQEAYDVYRERLAAAMAAARAALSATGG